MISESHEISIETQAIEQPDPLIQQNQNQRETMLALLKSINSDWLIPELSVLSYVFLVRCRASIG
jgi:hypothetical protein